MSRCGISSLSRLAPLLLASLLLLAPRARAGGFGEFELGGFAGGRFFAPDDELGRNDTDGAANQINHGFIGGLRLAFFFHSYIGLELEAAVVPTSTATSGTTVIGLPWRGHLMVHFYDGRIRPFIVLGYGATTVVHSSNEKDISKDTDESPHGGLGVKFDITRSFGLRLDGRVHLPPRIKDSSITWGAEAMLGIYGRLNRAAPPKPADRDGDTVPDATDKCPDEAGEVEHAGCPGNRDNDGLIDRLDACPDERGPTQNRGCPYKDGDGDGVLDKDDKCPSEAGVKENQGCPDTDLDGDGIVDRLDRCVKEKGTREDEGCPPKDTDGDGVIDRSDKCVNDPETKNGFQDEDGCPDELPKEVKRFSGVIRGINFKSGSAVILKNSFTLLEQAAVVLKDNPSIRLEIEGHTDDVGKRAKNVKLSQDRADSVRQYMLGRGIDEARLRARGFGPERPIAVGKSSKARAENRRVEFRILFGNE